MTVYHAGRALLPEGWARDVRIDVEGGRIASVTQAPAEAGDLRLGVVLPALANVHSHAFQRAMAGLTERRSTTADDFWTWRAVMYRFVDLFTPDEVEAVAALLYVEMLEAGYAAVGEFHYLHHGPDGVPYADVGEMAARIAAAAETAGIGLTLLPVLYCRGGMDGRALEGGQRRFGSDLDTFAAIVERCRALPADAVGVAPHSLRAVSPDDIAAAVAMADDGPIHIHAAEQTREVADVEAALGARPVAYLLDRFGAGAGWCLIHATHLTEAETVALARSGAVAGLCPITEANLGDGIFQGVTFREAGGRFGIGSDSNLRITVAGELRALEDRQRLRDRQRALMAPPGGSVGRTLYDGALAGGAAALSRDAGAIRAGAVADFVALDGEAIATAGLDGDTLLDAWIFAAGDGLVTDVVSGGRHVVREGRHIRGEEVRRRAMPVLRRLRAAL